MPPGPGADDSVDVVVLGKIHHIGPGLLIGDTAGAAEVAFVRALERLCLGLWASDSFEWRRGFL